jgi:hypothetical protein
MFVLNNVFQICSLVNDDFFLFLYLETKLRFWKSTPFVGIKKAGKMLDTE